MSYSYKYPRPAVTVDCVVLNDNNVLLIKRLNTPFKDHWALPGGFIDIDETLEEAAYRELSEETGVKNICLKPFKVYDTPGRDPR